MASSSKKTTLLIYMPKKLKHIALQEIHYQLLNTCLIISSQSWRYCTCYLCQGCRERPSHKNLMGERCLCIICQIKKTYNMDRLYNLKNIQQAWKLYVNLKEDLRKLLVVGSHQNFWLYYYSGTFRSKKSRKNMLLKNYIKENYTHICFLDP